MSAMAYFSATPIGAGESVSEHVSKVVNSIRESGLSWRLTPMGTIVEGETLAEVLGAIERGVEQLGDVNRISISIKIDYRRDRKPGMDAKVDAVMKKIDG